MGSRVARKRSYAHALRTWEGFGVVWQVYLKLVGWNTALGNFKLAMLLRIKSLIAIFKDIQAVIACGITVAFEKM